MEEREGRREKGGRKGRKEGERRRTRTTGWEGGRGGSIVRSAVTSI